MSKISHSDVLAVKNVISLYCEALDSKDFMLLEKVFVEDVSADYPFNSDLQGVDAVAKAIRNRYRKTLRSDVWYPDQRQTRTCPDASQPDNAADIV
jgi:hypothetical protein